MGLVRRGHYDQIDSAGSGEDSVYFTVDLRIGKVPSGLGSSQGIRGDDRSDIESGCGVDEGSVEHSAGESVPDDSHLAGLTVSHGPIRSARRPTGLAWRGEARVSSTARFLAPPPQGPAFRDRVMVRTCTPCAPLSLHSRV